MLDFGFSEILLTSAIALVVLGPEKLPKVARQVGNWMGRARLMARQLSEQLEREVNAEELLKQQPKSSIPAPAPVPPAPFAPPAALAPPQAASASVFPFAASPPDDSDAAAAPPIPPEAVVAPPARRAPHPNSPEVMHAKSPAALQPATTPTPTTTPTPQQSSQ
jgi:sec-independent protein translocase protein TatB